MEWNDYQLLLAVVREGTVRGAARHLGVNHATVSRRLAQINDGPDGPLVQKSPSGLWPSKVGSAVVEAAESMERAAMEAERRRRSVDETLSGALTLSVPNIVLRHILFDDITRFTERYPSIALTIDGSERLVDLDRAEADIAIRTSNSPPEHWVGRRLFPYALSLYAHKDYLASKKPDELEWIAPPTGIARWPDWLSQSPFPDASIGLVMTDIAGRFEAIKRGVGMGRAACFMADPDPDLVRLPGAAVTMAEEFWVLSHPDFAKTARAQAAMRHFAEALREKRHLIEGCG